MPTLAELQAESWWTREVVTGELAWLGDELCRRTGRPASAAGDKGDADHLRGAHRSQEWILNSRYCTNRTYTVQSGLTAEQARHVAGFDFTPGAWGTTTNRTLMAAQTRRLVDAAKAGVFGGGVREVIGTLDGRSVYGYRVYTGTTFTSDSSHLDHWHLTFDRRRMRDRALMERILAVALGEDDDMTAVQEESGSYQYLIWRQHFWSNGATEFQMGNDPAQKIMPNVWLKELLAAVAVLGAKLDAVAARVDIDPAELAAVADAARAGAASVGPELVAAVVAQLPEHLRDEVGAEVETALRRVLGGLDAPAQS